MHRPQQSALTVPNPLERHFSPRTVAELWGYDESTIIRIFQDEPGVLKLKREAKGKRVYTSLKIPESVMNRKYAQMAT